MGKPFENDPFKISVRKHDKHIICSRDACDFILHAAGFQYLLWKAAVVINSYARNKIHVHAMSLLDKLDKAFNPNDVSRSNTYTQFLFPTEIIKVKHLPKEQS